ncbi:TIGR03619 family F420-dependent LLM class oxidoreductase [Parafrankia sp. EUN1f]|uniref:TIGR03619 family F420-dependent LLM class oxidoreductase n=1 Tax=Parafrankia sp. EUN1f TaxID=102897 RepID=UPI0001C473F1|nr:TIGR03619 family F420-dependent LLM class oxidoreductase [Parafrankia sp. EUN1f]EFC86776.1 Luciferase-like monooxygenase [Parafrankia sp. EUN1f]
MKYGLCFTHMLGPSPGAQDVVRLAQEAEKVGYYSIVASDHVLQPRSFDESTYPAGTLQSDVHWYDSFVVLAAIAARTQTIRLGTGVAVVPYRPPIQQAQAVATLDFISGGRLSYGAGVGWMREEFGALGVAFSDRGQRADEYLQVMKLLWSGNGEGHRGEFIDFPGGYLSPPPTQRPHPPILIGGDSPPALRRIARYGDGFYINWKTPEEFSGFLERLAKPMADRGRQVSDLYMQLGATDIDLVRPHKDRMSNYEALGLDEIIFCPVSTSAAEGLDMMRGFAAEFF